MNCNKRKILVTRSGSLGDTLTAIPFLKILRHQYPQAHITYLYETQTVATANTVLGAAGLVDEFIPYETTGSALKKLFAHARLYFALLMKRYHLAIVAESQPYPCKKELFLRLCLIPHVSIPKRLFITAKNTLRLGNEHVSDRLLALLPQIGIETPPPQSADFTYPLTPSLRAFAEHWLSEHKLEDKPLVAVAPWSNMPLKRWPPKRYAQVLTELCRKHGLAPVIFGGKDESDIADKILSQTGCGAKACGLPIEQGIALLSKCRFYLGNDTGTMHMAVAAGLKCVAIFSARGPAGRWHPYGPGHIVLRNDLPCSGCNLRECKEHRMECLLSITTEQVLQACDTLIKTGS